MLSVNMFTLCSFVKEYVLHLFFYRKNAGYSGVKGVEKGGGEWLLSGLRVLRGSKISFASYKKPHTEAAKKINHRGHRER